VALLERRHVLIQDEVEAGAPVEVVWNVHTRARIETDGGRALLSIGRARMEARVLTPDGARFEVIPADPLRPRRSSPTSTT
jgi:hypothetical protein